MIPFLHPTSDINGTSLQGYITIKYSELVAALGEPQWTDGDKTTAEWAFEQYKGATFTIYDYKEDVTPKGVYEWHIGGHDQSVIALVQALFPNHHVRRYR